MESRMSRQDLRRRLDTILERNQFSNSHCDVVITLYTDPDCVYVVKNDYSVRIKRTPCEPKHDLIIHLYNHDTDLFFSKFGYLSQIARFPEHNLYVEKCCCRLYSTSALPKLLRKCYRTDCHHGLSCHMRRGRVVDDIVRHVEATLTRLEDEGRPTVHGNIQATIHG